MSQWPSTKARRVYSALLGLGWRFKRQSGPHRTLSRDAWPDFEGYSACVPGLPGCWSQGASEAEAIENIRDAIREYLSVVDEQLRGEQVREVEVAV